MCQALVTQVLHVVARKIDRNAIPRQWKGQIVSVQQGTA